MGEETCQWPYTDSQRIMNSRYLDTVRLLLDVAPEVFSSDGFAMKGGTAINFFHGNMPRLSVDIDVVFMDHTISREIALEDISSKLREIQERVSKRAIVAEFRPLPAGEEIKLFLKRGDAMVKVEVNQVFRGTVNPVVRSRLAEEVRSMFTLDLELPTLDYPELYGSKLVAAMDRQHPRDLFDVAKMYERGGLTPEIIECFVSYLAGHNRAVHEVLLPNNQDLIRPFENEFVGMTREPVSLPGLEATRERLKSDLLAGLESRHREFLLGLVRCHPDWSLMRCGHLSELPAIRWKLLNLEKLRAQDGKKFDLQYQELFSVFERN
jgi:Nucleotidyl transferase AbiEii toxin, Type IV TA system